MRPLRLWVSAEPRMARKRLRADVLWGYLVEGAAWFTLVVVAGVIYASCWTGVEL